MFGDYNGAAFGQWWGYDGDGPPPVVAAPDWLILARRRLIRMVWLGFALTALVPAPVDARPTTEVR